MPCEKNARHGTERTVIALADRRNLIQAASGQSGTEVETLRRGYAQGRPDKKRELADAIELERTMWRKAS